MSEQQSSLVAKRVESTAPDPVAGRAEGAAEPGAGRATGRRRNDRIVSASAQMQEVVDQASVIARSNVTIVVSGRSGSGRKHVARAIHQWSPRAGGPLVEVELAGTTEPGQSRELFGEDGAPSAIARSRGGTLLIGSADQLSATALTQLTERLRSDSGSTRLLATVAPGGDAALAQLGAERIAISALADRVEDILPLAAHFLAEFATEEGVEPVGFSADARRWLVEEQWTGNVRELRERIRQAIRLAGKGAISAEALMLSTDGDDVPSFKEAKRAFETRYVEGLLRRCSGNISRAARMAKKDRKDFYDVIRRTSVDPGQFRG